VYYQSLPEVVPEEQDVRGKITSIDGCGASCVTRGSVQVTLPLLPLERREDGPGLQHARLVLIFVAPGQRGGPPGCFVRRPRRDQEGPKAAGDAQAHNVSPREARP
jgi:hypothetical protein